MRANPHYSQTQTSTKVMASLFDKWLLSCRMVIVLVSLLHLATFATSAASSVAAAGTAAEALLEWKASLDNKNQSLLSSWVGDHPCNNNWVGIA